MQYGYFQDSIFNTIRYFVYNPTNKISDSIFFILGRSPWLTIPRSIERCLFQKQPTFKNNFYFLFI